jgi:hypothetical protein
LPEVAACARTEANERAESLRPIIEPMRAKGLSLGAMARELTRRKIKTPRGGKWHAETIRQIVQRLAEAS